MKRFFTRLIIRCYYFYNTYDRDHNGVETPRGRRCYVPPQINTTDAEPLRHLAVTHPEG